MNNNYLYNTMHTNLKSILHHRTWVHETQSSFLNIETRFSGHLNQQKWSSRQPNSLYSEQLWSYIIPMMSICTAIQHALVFNFMVPYMIEIWNITTVNPTQCHINFTPYYAKTMVIFNYYIQLLLISAPLYIILNNSL